MEQEGDDLLDFASIKERLGFVARSMRRHRALAAAVFVFVVAGAAAALAVLPKTYRVESRLLIRNDVVLPSVAEPGRGPAEADSAPLRSARDVITARDNLIALIGSTDLLAQWSRHRAPALRLKDALYVELFGPVSEADRLEEMVKLLRRRLVIWDDAGGRPNEGTVTIAAEWPDAETAFRLVQAAQQGFTDARHVAEMSAISEASALLETGAASWRAEALAAEDAVRRARASRPSRRADPVAPVAPTPTASVQRRREAPDPEVERLGALLAAKQRVITDLEDARRRNVAELQRQLAEQRAIYTDRHPYVVRLRQSLDALTPDSPQLTALRQESSALEGELRTHLRRPADVDVEVPAPAPPPSVRVELPRREEIEDPGVEAARARLKFAVDKYQAMRARADGVKLELEARRAAFKYRYTVVVPAEMPKGPIRPKIALIAPAALLAGVALAALAAVLLDLRAGRILESWQVERALRLPVIAELRLP